MATFDLRAQVLTTSEGEAPDINEFERAGLDFEPSSRVKPPRVKASPIHIECVLWKTVELPSDLDENLLIIGRVLGIHINDACFTDGRIDLSRVWPLARLGYGQFSTVGEIVKGGA